MSDFIKENTAWFRVPMYLCFDVSEANLYRLWPNCVSASFEQQIRHASWPRKLLECQCYALLGIEHSMNTTASQVPKNRRFGANFQFLFSVRVLWARGNTFYTLILKTVEQIMRLSVQGIRVLAY
jgi:hypothetical protein